MIRAQRRIGFNDPPPLATAPCTGGANDRIHHIKKTERHSAWPVLSHTEKENEMSHANLSRRAIVAGAASVPALTLPVAGFASTEPDPVFAAIERWKELDAVEEAAFEARARQTRGG